MMTSPTALVLDPRGLTVAQLAGERCAVPNCRHRLTGPRTFLGQTPDGTPVFVCDDHDPSELAA